MGFVFAGTIVKVGETVEVGGTQPTSPEPEEPPEPAEPAEPAEPEETGNIGGAILTNEEGDSVDLGSGESAQPASSAPPASPSEGSSEGACATAFILLALGAVLFVKKV